MKEALPGEVGGFRSLVGILKCLVSAFCQGFTLLSEIERHTFVLVAILIKWQTALSWIFPHLPVVTMAAFSSFWDFWPSFPFLTSFLTFLFTRPFHLGPWFTLVFFVILVHLLMLSSHDQRISQIKRLQRLTQQITDRHKEERTNTYVTDSLVPRTSHVHCVFVYGARYANCAANRRYLAYFLLFMSFYEFWSSKKITIGQTGPNYFNFLSLIFGFEVAVGRKPLTL